MSTSGRLAGAWLVIVVLVLLMVPAPANAADPSWDGGGGDGLWSNPLNWSGDVLPTTALRVTIAGGAAVHIDTDVTVGGLLVEGIDTTLIVDAGSTLTLDSTTDHLTSQPFFVSTLSALTNEGTINVLDGQLSASNFTNAATGVVTHADTLSIIVGANHGVINANASLHVSGSFDNYGDIVVSRKQIRWWGRAPDAFTNHAAASLSGSGWLVIGNEPDPTTFNGIFTNDGTVNITAEGFGGMAITNNTTIVNNGSITTVGPLRLGCGGDVTGAGTVAGTTLITCHTWVGGGSTTNWSEVANWSFAAPPSDGGTKDVLLWGGGTIHLDVAANLGSGRTSIAAGTTVVIDASGTLTLPGRLENKGTLSVLGGLVVTSTGVIANTGVLSNAGAINNSGDIFNGCTAGTFVALPGGTLIGNPPRAECPAWDGGGGDGVWSNPLNWSGDLLPDSRSRATVELRGVTVHVDSNVTIGGLLVHGIGTTLIVDAGSTLTLDTTTSLPQPFFVSAASALTNEGTINVVDGQLSASNFTNAATGVVTHADTLSIIVGANHGVINANSHLQVSGSFDNYGDIVLGSSPIIKRLRWWGRAPDAFTNHAGASLSGSGWLQIGNEVDPTTFNGIFTNNGAVDITAAGFTHGMAITNNTTIVNNSSITASTIQNDGTIQNGCRSILVGTISGNPPVESVCADLSLSLTAPATVLPGATFSYVIDVFNDGPATAARVVVTDQLPTGASLLSTVVRTAFCTVEGGVTSCGGSVDIEACLQTGATVACSLGDLPDGGTGEVTLTVQLAAGVIGTLTNRAAVSTTSTDSDPSNDTATATTEVADTIPPSISCPADIGIANDSGQAHATVSYSATATDNAPGVTVACAPPAGSRFPLGSTGVTCTATDAAGNTASCSFAVTVTDTEPPVVACPANLTVPNDPGQANAVVDYTMATATDNAPGVTVVSSPPSGSVFPLGTTSVAATATDAAGNTATCAFTVTVNDAEPPIPSCPADITAPNDPGQSTAVVAYAATATDNAPGVTVACLPRSGSPFPVGVTSVMCTATDAAGNTRSCLFALTVDDVEPPVVTPPPDRTAEATSPAGAVVSDAELGLATATDNVPGVTVTRTGVPAGNVFPLGVTDITYTATDAAGNTATATQRVTVRDTTPPTITISSPAATTYTLNQAVLSDYTCTDAVSAVTSCAGPVPSGSSFDTGSVGSKMFAVSAADAAGNAATRSVSYSVGYGVCLLYDPNRAVRAGGTLPIKIQLCDAAGVNVSASMLVVTALQLVKMSGATTATVEDTGNANPDGNFRYDPALGATGGYIFNLSTAGLTTGTYALVWSATGDATRHDSEVIFQVK